MNAWMSRGKVIVNDAGEVVICDGCPCDLECVFSVTLTLDWGDVANADLDAYLREGALPPVYFTHPTEGPLTLNQDAHPGGSASPSGPEIITGSYTISGSLSFTAWYNQYSASAPPTTPTTAHVTVANLGAHAMCVNGVTVAAGGAVTIGPVAYAGYATGSVPGFGGGTVIDVACGAC